MKRPYTVQVQDPDSPGGWRTIGKARYAHFDSACVEARRQAKKHKYAGCTIRVAGEGFGWEFRVGQDVMRCGR